LQEAEIIENKKVLTMEEELNLILKNVEAPPSESENFSKLRRIFTFFLYLQCTMYRKAYFFL
jgi:hypothetical protein